MSVGPEWTFHGAVLPPGIVEDFVVSWRPEAGQFDAHWVEGSSFQDEHIHWGRAPTPLGPFQRMGPTVARWRAHTRLYRGRIGVGERLISAVWPGLPRIGIWHFTDMEAFEVKQLFIGPEGHYHMAACNPCVHWVNDPNPHFEIFFEGRGEVVRWSLFHATWDGVGRPVVDPEPFLEGAANPSLLVSGGRLYLYYSQHADGGLFSTRCMSRAL